MPKPWVAEGPQALSQLYIEVRKQAMQPCVIQGCPVLPGTSCALQSTVVCIVLYQSPEIT